MIEYDCLKLPLSKLLELLDAADASLPTVRHLKLPVRVLHLPVAFNDEWTNASIQRCRVLSSLSMSDICGMVTFTYRTLMSPVLRVPACYMQYHI